jgi:hypothetical protein
LELAEIGHISDLVARFVQNTTPSP